MPLNSFNRQYEWLLSDTLSSGLKKSDRTGTGTRSVFGRQLRFNLETEGFPLISSKKVHFKSVAEELFWMLRGDTNIKSLNEAGVTIWDEWADENGDLGPVYGAQWRNYLGSFNDGTPRAVDQIAQVIESIEKNPDSRRHIVTAWNPPQIDEMKLPPCHLLFQFYVRDGRLDLQLYQRSADLFLGVPFNIASYALLLSLIAKETGLIPGEFIWTGGDCHIYDNHIAQVQEQISREPRRFPSLWLSDYDDMFNLDWTDVSVMNYNPHPAIKADVAV